MTRNPAWSPELRARADQLSRGPRRGAYGRATQPYYDAVNRVRSTQAESLPGAGHIRARLALAQALWLSDATRRHSASCDLSLEGGPSEMLASPSSEPRCPATSSAIFGAALPTTPGEARVRYWPARSICL